MSRIVNIGIVLIVFGVSIFCYGKDCIAGQKGVVTVPKKTIAQVIREHTGDLMSVPGVVGTAEGLCDNKPCIKVYVVRKSPEIDEKIPHSLGGYPVRVEVSGEFHTMPEKSN